MYCTLRACVMFDENYSALFLAKLLLKSHSKEMKLYTAFVNQTGKSGSHIFMQNVRGFLENVGNLK